MTSHVLCSQLRSQAVRPVSWKFPLVLLSIALARLVAVSSTDGRPSGFVPSGFVVSTPFARVNLKPPLSRWVLSRKKECRSFTRDQYTGIGVDRRRLPSRPTNEKETESTERPDASFSEPRGRGEAPGVKRLRGARAVRKGGRGRYSGQAFAGKNRSRVVNEVERRHYDHNSPMGGGNVEETPIDESALKRKGRMSSGVGRGMQSSRKVPKGDQRRRKMSVDEKLLRGYTKRIMEAGRHGRWKDALLLFEELKRKGLSPNTFTFSALISAMEKAPGGSQWKKALGVFQQMKRRGVKPDTVTLNALISDGEGSGGESVEEGTWGV